MESRDEITRDRAFKKAFSMTIIFAFIGALASYTLTNSWYKTKHGFFNEKENYQPANYQHTMAWIELSKNVPTDDGSANHSYDGDTVNNLIKEKVKEEPMNRKQIKGFIRNLDLEAAIEKWVSEKVAVLTPDNTPQQAQVRRPGL